MRTMVPTFTILDTLNASTIVTMAGSPSGTAATASEIAVKSMSPTSLFCINAITNNSTQISTAIILKNFPRSARRFCKGVNSSPPLSIMSAILPICVCIPVAVTTPSPLPAVTVVVINTMLLLSKILLPFSNTGSADFTVGTDSPVKAASSTCKFTACINRISAGTCLPASKKTISPGTNNSLGISVCIPFLFTNALGLVNLCNASIALRAFPSCITPITAFNTITTAIMPASSASFKNREIAIATINM